LLDGLQHGAARRLVEDELAALHCLVDRGLVEDVGLDEASGTVDVLSAPRRQVVEHHHVGAAFHECIDEMRADEPRPAGDQRTHVPPSG
jgi:hypothetical protein